MVATVISLLVIALLVLVGAKAIHRASSHSSSTGSSVHQLLSVAAATQALQPRSTALTAVGTAASAAGNYARIATLTLEASEPSITFVDGPSTGSNTVSIALTTDVSESVTLAGQSSD